MWMRRGRKVEALGRRLRVSDAPPTPRRGRFLALASLALVLSLSGGGTHPPAGRGGCPHPPRQPWRRGGDAFNDGRRGRRWCRRRSRRWRGEGPDHQAHATATAARRRRVLGRGAPPCPPPGRGGEKPAPRHVFRAERARGRDVHVGGGGGACGRTCASPRVPQPGFWPTTTRSVAAPEDVAAVRCGWWTWTPPPRWRWTWSWSWSWSWRRR